MNYSRTTYSNGFLTKNHTPIKVHGAASWHACIIVPPKATAMQSRAIQLYLSPLPAITGLHLTRLMRFPASPDGLPSTNHLLGPLQPSHLPLLFWPDRSQLHIALAVATLAACHRLRVASPEVVQRLKWRNDGGAPGEHSHQHTHHPPLHRAGDAGRHDLGTTPRLRRTRKEPTEGQLGHCAKSTGRAQLMA